MFQLKKSYETKLRNQYTKRQKKLIKIKIKLNIFRAY
jgi:hypothetical protein